MIGMFIWSQTSLRCLGVSGASKGTPDMQNASRKSSGDKNRVRGTKFSLCLSLRYLKTHLQASEIFPGWNPRPFQKGRGKRGEEGKEERRGRSCIMAVGAMDASEHTRQETEWQKCRKKTRHVNGTSTVNSNTSDCKQMTTQYGRRLAKLDCARPVAAENDATQLYKSCSN